MRNFAREEFALKHRYAMVLHTDEPHPHVHVVVKAVSEQGERFNIRKATPRDWRREFARHLRAQGIAANATDRYLRGETKPHKLDGIHRAVLRGDSTHMRARAEAVASELLKGDLRVERGKSNLMETRKEVERGWRSVSEILASEGQTDLAAQVRLVDLDTCDTYCGDECFYPFDKSLGELFANCGPVNCIIAAVHRRRFWCRAVSAFWADRPRR